MNANTRRERPYEVAAIDWEKVDLTNLIWDVLEFQWWLSDDEDASLGRNKPAVIDGHPRSVDYVQSHVDGWARYHMLPELLLIQKAMADPSLRSKWKDWRGARKFLHVMTDRCHQYARHLRGEERMRYLQKGESPKERRKRMRGFIKRLDPPHFPFKVRNLKTM
jgi:hypothetical protein